MFLLYYLKSHRYQQRELNNSEIFYVVNWTSEYEDALITLSEGVMNFDLRRKKKNGNKQANTPAS